jgi:hypothetical protein
VLLEGPEIEPLLTQVRAEYGAEVKIISAEKVRTGGIGGFFAKQKYELSVEVPDGPAPGPQQAPAAPTPDARTGTSPATPRPGVTGGGPARAAADAPRTMEELLAQVEAQDRYADGDAGTPPPPGRAEDPPGGAGDPPSTPGRVGDPPPRAGTLSASGAAFAEVMSGFGAGPVTSGPGRRPPAKPAVRPFRPQPVDGPPVNGGATPPTRGTAITPDIDEALIADLTSTAARLLDAAAAAGARPTTPSRPTPPAEPDATSAREAAPASAPEATPEAAVPPPTTPNAAAAAAAAAPAAPETAPPPAPAPPPPAPPAGPPPAPAPPPAAPPAAPPPTAQHPAASAGAGAPPTVASAPPPPPPLPEEATAELVADVRTLGAPQSFAAQFEGPDAYCGVMRALEAAAGPPSRSGDVLVLAGDLAHVAEEATAKVVDDLRMLGMPEPLARRVDGPDTYSGVMRALAQVERAPAPPSRPGDVLVIAGERAHAVPAARRILGELELDESRLLLAGPSGAGTGIHASRRIRSVSDAERRGRRMRRADDAHVVVVDAPLRGLDPGYVRDVCDALDATAVWAVVDATRKTADTVRYLDALGDVEAIVVHGVADTTDPASVLALDLPIVSLDGQPATRRAWAALICERLTADLDEIVPARRRRRTRER